MNILFRAIITGFGLRLGSEIAKTIAGKARREGKQDDDDSKEESPDPDDEDLGSITPDPPQV